MPSGRRASRALELFLAFTLAVVTAFGGLLPAVARLAGGPPPHVCHCEVRGGHATCQCPRCNPELRDETDTHAVRAACGDDEDATLGKAFAAVVRGGIVVGAPRDVGTEPIALPPPPFTPRLPDGPESPPPRHTRA